MLTMAVTYANNGYGHELFHFAFSFFSTCRSIICRTTSDNGMPSLAASFSRKSSWRLVKVIDSLGFDAMMQICITFVNCQAGKTTQTVGVGAPAFARRKRFGRAGFELESATVLYLI